MLDIGWTEIVMISVVALVVLGPKELPRALKTFGAVMAKARGMAREFQSGVDEMIRETELDDLRKDLEKATRLDFDDDKARKIDPTTGKALAGEKAKPPAIQPPAQQAAQEPSATPPAEAAPGSNPGTVPQTAPAAADVPLPDGAATAPAVTPAAGPVSEPGQQRPAAVSALSGPETGPGLPPSAPPLSSAGFDQDYGPARQASAARSARVEEVALGEFVPPEGEGEGEAADASRRQERPQTRAAG